MPGWCGALKLMPVGSKFQARCDCHILPIRVILPIIESCGI